jgi:para-aminobenzoate synthetase/4-amino-4-deoxychorismate lyase
MRCRVHTESLGPGPAPDQVLRLMAGAPGLMCLWGSWAGGGALVLSRPLRVHAGDREPAAVLADQPRVEDADPAVVGGGWFGVLGYDAPSSHLAFYDHVLRYDAGGEWHFEALWTDERAAELSLIRDQIRVLLRAGPVRADWRAGTFTGPPALAHLAAVERAVELIRAGDLYQVNVCTRLGAPFEGSAAGLFADTAARLRPAYGAFVDTGAYSVASLSPELFLRRRGDQVTTSPIKGTVPRRQGPLALRRSAKDAAENVMIVDLMRNDLGRVARTGSVHVAELLSLEPHPGVWHLVSTVTASVDGDDADLLRATFPPGSVTGAPKVRAMQAIAELESAARAVYTGAIGFASPSWGLEFSVAIRTFEIGSGRMELGVGGGITADSVPMLEWRECLHKAAPLLDALGARLAGDLVTPESPPAPEQSAGGLLETVLAVDGSVLRLSDHLARLDRSSRELYGRGLPGDLAARVRQAASATRSGRAAIRVVASADGRIAISASPAPSRPNASDVLVVKGRYGLWRHKWADRRWLTEAERANGVPLFVADDGTVLETSRGNVFLLHEDGTLVTPPLRDDLLPGVTRRALLDLAHDLGRPTRLATFTVDDLRSASAAFWTSSLSGLIPIASVDGFVLARRDTEVARLADCLFGGAAAEC